MELSPTVVCVAEFMHCLQLLVNLYDLDSRGYSIYLLSAAVRAAVRIQIMEMVSLRQSSATISEEVEVHAEITGRLHEKHRGRRRFR